MLAEGPPVDLALKALRVVMDGARRAGRDDVALAATARALALATGEKRAPWLLESAKIQQKKNREGALAALDRLVADYPKAGEADDALLLKARMLEAGPDPKSAEAVYLKLAQGYPESEEGIAAQWRLGWLSWLRSDYTEAAERWARITTIRVASQNYRDAALYWTARAHTAAGQAESASKYFAQLISESPRSYYGVLALRRVPRLPPHPGRNPAAVQLAASLPADPREFLQGDAPYARIEALHAVGLDDFADEEMDELVRRSLADTRRLYALATVYAQDSRYYLSLRIMRRHFLGLARSAPPAVPRTFWEAFYPIGWRSELNEAAARAAVDPYLVAAVVREESSYNAQARSRVGARGLMQLMPDTAKPMARQRGLPFNDGAILDEPFANLTPGQRAPRRAPQGVRGPAPRRGRVQRGRHSGAPVVEGAHHGRSRGLRRAHSVHGDARLRPTRHARLGGIPPPLRERRGRPTVTGVVTAGFWRRFSAFRPRRHGRGGGVGVLLHVAGDRALGPRQPPQRSLRPLAASVRDAGPRPRSAHRLSRGARRRMRPDPGQDGPGYHRHQA